MENNPYVAKIFHKAQDNSRNQDSKQYLDKTVKEWQQKLLHAFRMLGNLSSSDGSNHLHTLVLQIFHVLADLEESMYTFQKTQSIKGSVAHSTQLFN